MLPCTVRLPLLVNWAPLTSVIGPLPVHSALVLAVLKLRPSSVFVPVPLMFSVAPLATSVAPLPPCVPLVQSRLLVTVRLPVPVRVPLDCARLSMLSAVSACSVPLLRLTKPPVLLIAAPPLNTWVPPLRFSCAPAPRA